MIYLGWYDDNTKKKIAAKIDEAIVSIRAEIRARTEYLPGRGEGAGRAPPYTGAGGTASST